MKTIFTAISVIAAFIASFHFNANAQKPFTGTIEYSVVALGGGASGITQILPTKVTVHIKGNDVVESVEGGILVNYAGNKTIYLGDQNVKYKVFDNKKKAIKIVNAPQKNIDRIKEKDKSVVLGYECIKYTWTENYVYKGDTSLVDYSAWVAADLDAPASKILQDGSYGLFINQIGKIVLCRVSVMYGISVIYTATRIDLNEPPDSVFELPKNYFVEDDTVKK